MDTEALRRAWQAEEDVAHIHGWDFSHIDGRYDEADDFPWDYRAVVNAHLRPGDRLLDIDTGGGEFLLSLGHPAALTAATEGYPPNVELCRRTLVPLGIDFREMDEPPIPFEDARFDVVIDRHGSFDIPELRRVLRPGGWFITQQVGDDNDRELAELLLPDLPRPAPGLNLRDQRAAFEAGGFEVVESGECFRPIRFFDVGALVWFARIIVWEFPGFSVDACFDRLLEAQRQIEAHGSVDGTTHRYMIAARKK